MKNQSVALYKGTENTYSDERKTVIELEYRNGEQNINIRLFLTKAWNNFVNGLDHVLHPFKRKNDIDLKNVVIIWANDRLYLTRIVKAPDSDNTLVYRSYHQHYVDMFTGSVFCYCCNPSIPHGRIDVYGLPTDYMTEDEYVRFNDGSITHNEKMQILFSVLQRANNEYQEEKASRNK